MKSLAAVAALVVAIGGASITIGCGNDTQTTTTPSPTPTSPTTSTFASRLTVGGAVSRSFTATQAGNVTVMLTNAGGPFTRVGLGLGVPTTGFARCALTTSISATPGAAPQITAPVDAGRSCVAIFDLGNLTDAIDFSMTLVFP